MDRIVGIETEYGCLVSDEEPHVSSEVWPAKVKTYLFRKAAAGTIDLHYRDYEEPPGNGGFLLNGGRLYLDMGHIEYSTPECYSLRDVVSFYRVYDGYAATVRTQDIERLNSRGVRSVSARFSTFRSGP